MSSENNNTRLQKIRNFLILHQGGPAPWERPARVVERLYEALCQQKDDERFWQDLKDLVHRLEDGSFHAWTGGNEDVLQGATLDKLLDDLRFSLNGNGKGTPGTGLKHWLSRSVGGTALLAFLLLATAFSNGRNDTSRLAAAAGGNETVPADEIIIDDDTADSLRSDTMPMTDALVAGQALVDDDTLGAPGLGEELAADVIAKQDILPADEVIDDLVGIIIDANVPNGVKEDLLACLPELDAAYREALLEKFAGLDDEALAAFLEVMDQSEGVQIQVENLLAVGDDLNDENQPADEQLLEQQAANDNPFDDCCGCGGSSDDDDDDDH